MELRIRDDCSCFTAQVTSKDYICVYHKEKNSNDQIVVHACQGMNPDKDHAFFQNVCPEEKNEPYETQNPNLGLTTRTCCDVIKSGVKYCWFHRKENALDDLSCSTNSQPTLIRWDDCSKPKAKDYSKFCFGSNNLNEFWNVSSSTNHDNGLGIVENVRYYTIQVFIVLFLIFLFGLFHLLRYIYKKMKSKFEPERIKKNLRPKITRQQATTDQDDSA